ncbi:MAG: aminotransferase class I/II-fold pyridoxal phosphate-dependent enzyme [Thermoanaerobacterales bacterium]|nr:aminotransferase class I/II-fold pyridoxal phosphate-dependent enzyme [Thermoanaerobacterales bacterium]
MTSPDQSRLPIVEAIRDYLGVGRIHMPGHKGGTGVAEPFLSLVGYGAFQADVVGVEGLDDFHAPHGCIAEALALAAEAWGADHTFFLVNGTSCGLHALVLALCGPGDELIIPRNVHRSVVGALILSGARPVYMEPDLEESFGLPLGVSPRTVEKTVAQHPEAKGVLIVGPTYYGVIPDIRAIAEIAHAHGLPLLVDEAHGAHLGFHPGLPPSSLQQGADAVAQGVHKTAGSFSQGSILHLQGERVPVERVRGYLRILQTTSPSYLILGSLDAARFLLANEGHNRLQRVLNMAARITAEVGTMERTGTGVRCLNPDFLQGPFRTDPTRIVINVRETGLSGHKVERVLRYEHGVQIELSDFSNIVLLLSPGDTPETIDAFLTAFKQVISGAPGASPTPAREAGLAGGLLPPTPPMVLIPAHAFGRPARRVRLDEAAGLVSAEMVAAYPPGVPVIYPGERLTPPVIAYLARARDAGVHLQGAEDGRLEFINVID